LKFTFEEFDEFIGEIVIIAGVRVEKKFMIPENLPETLNIHLRLLKENSNFTAKLGEIQNTFPSDLSFKQLILIGLGEESKMSPETVRRAFGSLGNYLRSHNISKVGIYLTSPLINNSESLFEGIRLGNYRFTRYFTIEEKITKPLEIITVLNAGGSTEDIQEAITRTDAIVQGTNMARDLGNLRSNHATPAHLADEAAKLKELNIGVTVLNAEAIKNEQMRLFLAVAQGSLETDPPKFIIMEYNPENYKKTLCLIGKGITFDTGGMNLKSREGMHPMFYDMSGGGAVIGAMKAIALLKPKVRVIGLVPATPNVPDARAYRPSDIIESRGKKQVEIISTDAEGRNLLADALDYAKKYQPDLVIDIATLTGGIMIALGHVNAGFYVNEEAADTAELFFNAGRKSGDYLWQMPLDPDYFEYLKSPHADFKHSGGSYGSSVTAAMFLKQFTDYPWAHIDIAGVAFKGFTYGGKPKFYNPKKGATGFGVRLIVEFVRTWG
jgi:leucyl aminopeptidase